MATESINALSALAAVRKGSDAIRLQRVTKLGVSVGVSIEDVFPYFGGLLRTI
jgi:hypothetical protein